MQDRDNRPTSEQGLFRKYDVQRVDGKSDGNDPAYLVLRINDLTDEKPESVALRAYIDAARERYPKLASDLSYYLRDVPVASEGENPDAFCWRSGRPRGRGTTRQIP